MKEYKKVNYRKIDCYKAVRKKEGIGKDINMIIGNGYTKGHAEMALNILRESKEIRDLYESIYSTGT